MRRMDRYQETKEETSTNGLRAERNETLYENIGHNAKFTNFTDVRDVNAVSLDSAKKNSRTREGYHQIKEFGAVIDTTPKVKKELEEFNYLYQDHENKVYDINSVLEDAKKNRVEKDALEEKRKLKNTNYNILASLNPEELEKYRNEKKNRNNKPNPEELKGLINTITSKTLAGEIDKATSVNLLSDLMATSMHDTLPSQLKELSDEKTDKEEVKKDVSEKSDDNKKEEISTEDKLDLSKEIIDTEAIKKAEEVKKDTTNDLIKDMDQSFYTKSMDLSDKDFEIEGEEEVQKTPAVVRIILILLLFAVIGVGVYIVVTGI